MKKSLLQLVFLLLSLSMLAGCLWVPVDEGGGGRRRDHQGNDRGQRPGEHRGEHRGDGGDRGDRR